MAEFEKDLTGNNAVDSETEALMERIELFLESGNFPKVYEYADRVLDKYPKNAKAYIYKLLAETGARNMEELAQRNSSFAQSESYVMAVRFADEEVKRQLEDAAIKAYNAGVQVNNDYFYNNAVAKKDGIKKMSDCEEAIKLFEELGEWRDSKVQAEECRKKLEEMKAEKAKSKEKSKKKLKRLISVVAIVAVLAVLLTVLGSMFMPMIKYSRAVGFVEDGEYVKAKVIFLELGDYKDSRTYADNIEIVYDEVVIRESNGSVSTIEYTYDNNGNMIKKVDNADSVEYTYDNNGNLIKRVHTDFDGDIETTEYTYDENGNLIKKVHTDPDGDIETNEYTYDNNGNMIKQVHTDPDGDKAIINYTYDENGNMIKEVYTGWSDFGYSFDNTYDNKGNLIKQVHTYSDGDIETYEYTYDKKGNEIKQVYTNSDGGVETNEFTYTGEHVFYRG